MYEKWNNHIPLGLLTVSSFLPIHCTIYKFLNSLVQHRFKKRSVFYTLSLNLSIVLFSPLVISFSKEHVQNNELCMLSKAHGLVYFYMGTQTYLMLVEKKGFFFTLYNLEEKKWYTIEQYTMCQYKLISWLIVHCNVKSVYRALNYCIRELQKLNPPSRNGSCLNKKYVSLREIQCVWNPEG